MNSKFFKQLIVTLTIQITLLYSADITGHITTDIGVPGIDRKIEIENLNTGETFTTYSDTAGVFNFSDVYVAVDESPSIININYTPKAFIDVSPASANNVHSVVSNHKNYSGKSTDVFDITGKKVAGIHTTQYNNIISAHWDGKTNKGTHASEGIYFYKMPNNAIGKFTILTNAPAMTNNGILPATLSNIKKYQAKQIQKISLKQQSSGNLKKSTENFPTDTYEFKISGYGAKTLIDTIRLSQGSNDLSFTLEAYKGKDVVGRIYNLKDLIDFSFQELNEMDKKSIPGMPGIEMELMDDQTIIDVNTPYGLAKKVLLSNNSLKNVLEETNTDINGDYFFKDLTPGFYVMNISSPDTSTHFSRYGIMIEVTPKTSLKDTTQDVFNYVMTHRDIVIPNSDGETLKISEAHLFHGKHFNTINFDFIYDKNHRDNANNNINFARQRPVGVYLSEYFRSDDSAGVKQVFEWAKHDFNIDFYFSGATTPHDISLTDEERENFDPVNNFYPEKCFVNCFRGQNYETHATGAAKIVNYSYDSFTTGANINLGYPGSILNKTSTYKELAFRLGGYLDNSLWIGLGNTSASMPRTQDFVTFKIHNGYIRMQVAGFEHYSGKRTDNLTKTN